MPATRRRASPLATAPDVKRRRRHVSPSAPAPTSVPPPPSAPGVTRQRRGRCRSAFASPYAQVRASAEASGAARLLCWAALARAQVDRGD